MRKVILIFSLLTAGCSGSKIDSFNKERIRGEVNEFIQSYALAVQQLDAEKVIAHLSTDSEFYVFGGGEGAGLEEFKGIIRNDFFKGVKSININYERIEIRVLDDHTAIAMTTLNQTVVDSLSNEIKLKLEDAWVCVKQDDRWKLIFSHDTLLKE